MHSTGDRLLNRARRAALVPALALGLTTLAVVSAAPASAAAPPNDNLANASTLVPGTATSSTTVDATLEGAEGQNSCADMSNSVWFTWTSQAGASQPDVTVRTSSALAGFDTVLGVWTKANATFPLTEVTCNDDENGPQLATSRADFTPAPSTTYYFQVGNYGGSTDPGDPGPGAFSIRLTSPPNDDLADAEVLPLAASTTLAVDPTNASNEAGELFTSGCGTGAHSVWYKVRPEASGPLHVVTSGDPTRDTIVRVLSGPATSPTLPALTTRGCNDDIDFGGGNYFSDVNVTASAGTTYYVNIAEFDTVAGTTFGPFSVTVTVPLAATPPNDDLAQAMALTDGTTTNTTTLGSTLQAGEVGQPSCDEIVGSVWFKWTSPAVGVHTVVETLGGADGFDSVLNVWSGPPSGATIAGLDEVGCNDEGGPGHLSAADFDADPSTTYYIQLSNYGLPEDGDPGRGPVQIRLHTLPPPTNDDLAQAESLALNGSDTFDNTRATTEAGEAGQAACDTDKTAWYKYAPAATSAVTVDTVTDNTVDTSLNVWTGPATGATIAGLAAVACNDDINLDNNDLASSVTFQAQVGTTYYIQAGSSVSQPPGSITISLKPFVPALSTTALTATANGQQVTLQATVSSSPAPAGTVEFFDGATSVGSTPLSGGGAGKVVSGVGFGHHSYHAVFTSSDFHVAGSTSPDQAVDLTAPTPAQQATSTKLTVPKKVAAGKKATIIVEVSTSNGPASGTVTITVGGKATTATLVNGKATITKKLKKPGKIAVSASYAATSTTQASSATASIKVKKKPKKK